mgnify:CR=1 FL=1|jgi:NAD(P)H-hydrate epimerase
MKKMESITSEEMKIIELNASYLGIHVKDLMESAGERLFYTLKERDILTGKSVGIICGTGNNGGDGFVLAKYLKKYGIEVDVIFPWAREDIKTKDAQNNFDILKDGYGSIIKKKMDRDYDIIIDSIIGTGIKGKLREPTLSLIENINKKDAYKISVDVPTGIGFKNVLDSDLVIGLHRLKTGTETYENIVTDIGIPSKAETHVGPGNLLANLKTREVDAKKGDNGKICIVGGSKKYYGAPLLTTFAAQNSGADLVYLNVPQINFDVTRCYSPDIIVRTYPGDYFNRKGVDAILDLSKKCDSMVIGPGISMNPEVNDAVFDILTKIRIPTVIDAEALKIIPDVKPRKNWVITPHSKEFEILTGKKIPSNIVEMTELVSRWSKKLGVTILLKAYIDIITSPKGNTKLNDTGNPGMTVGGTGDVLAGIVGGFISQGIDPYDAACCAAFVNGCAGDRLYSKKGYGFTAMDLASQIPYTVKEIMDSDFS